jgi:exopolysaccharide biosynthesis polyprenyl glycosylphosphotransferase
MSSILGRKTNIFYSLTVLIDAVTLFYCDIFAFRVHLGPQFQSSHNFLDYSNIIAIVVLFKLIILYVFQLYKKERFRSNYVISAYIIKACSASALVTVVLAYLLRDETIPRMVVVLSWFCSIFFLAAWRILVKSVFELFFGKGYFKSQLLIIGTNKTAENVAVWLLNNGLINYNLVGFIKDDPLEVRENLLGFPILDSIENIRSIPKRFRIDHVFVMSPHLELKDISRIFSAFRRKKEVTFCTTPDLYDEMISCDYLEEGRIKFFSAVPFQSVPPWYPALKRTTDIVVSLILLILLMPLFIVIAIVIKVSSPGALFYLSKRIGYMGKSFVMIKFRSMYAHRSRARVERWAEKEDPRVTEFGKVMRRYRLDELPQLINVLRGDMSLIGPRPETKYYVLRLLKGIPLYSERFNSKPGITGWAQVNFGYAGTLEESRRKLLFDIYYIQNQSLFLDILITLKTLVIVLSGSGR